MKTKYDYEQRIIETLQNALEPLDVEKIKVKANIGNWNTALKHCLQLMISKKIRGIKTSKSWIFWIEKENKHE